MSNTVETKLETKTNNNLCEHGELKEECSKCEVDRTERHSIVECAREHLSGELGNDTNHTYVQMVYREEISIPINEIAESYIDTFWGTFDHNTMDVDVKVDRFIKLVNNFTMSRYDEVDVYDKDDDFYYQAEEEIKDQLGDYLETYYYDGNPFTPKLNVVLSKLPTGLFKDEYSIHNLAKEMLLNGTYYQMKKDGNDQLSDEYILMSYLKSKIDTFFNVESGEEVVAIS